MRSIIHSLSGPVNLWPSSKWQRGLATALARSGGDDERLSELPIRSIRRGETYTVRLLPPPFAPNHPGLKLIEHLWPPFDYNASRVHAICPARSDPAIFGASTPTECPACAAGVGGTVAVLVYAAGLREGEGATMLRIPEWREVAELDRRGAFDLARGRAVTFERDNYGGLEVMLRDVCAVTDEDLLLGLADEVHLPRRPCRMDLLSNMAEAVAGWEKAGRPEPLPDQHRDLMEHLPEATLVPIPWGFKGPQRREWNQVTLARSRDYDYRMVLDDGNIGLLCGRNDAGIIIGLDADEERLAQALVRANPILATTFAVEGRPGRVKWFVLAIGPAAEKALRSTKICRYERGTDNGKAVECGDWLATGKQGLVWGLHPSGRWYRPNWLSLQALDVREFVLPAGYFLKAAAGEDLDSPAAQYRAARRHGHAPDVDLDALASALDCIDPDERDTWFRVGAALKAAGQESGNLAATRKLFDTWSRRSRKYDLAGQGKLWDSVSNGGGITPGTIFYLARQGGWEGCSANEYGYDE